MAFNKRLRIGEDFTLPIEFVTSTQTILARKRSGKSYCASVQAEELLSAHQQVAVIDPTGAWHGLKSSADGLSAGFPIVVFGGEHADVPLDGNAGGLLARTMVEQGFSAIFDVSLMGVAEAIRFVTAFMNDLFRLNREAMHLFIDEADAYAPERPFGEETKSLAAIKRLVKQGGIRGIGVTMITQRPQQLAKSILSQVDILTVLRMSHPLDIKAATDWISSEVSVEFAAEVRKSLPSLPVGTAFICSAPLDIGERVVIRERKTFNSGATPKPGEKRAQPKVMAKVDLEKLGKEIQDTVEKAKANDPETLKKRIAELEKGSKPSEAQDMIIASQQNRIAELEYYSQGMAAQYDTYVAQKEMLAKHITALYDAFYQNTEASKRIDLPAPSQRSTWKLPDEQSAKIDTPRREARKVVTNGNLRSGARRMLTVLVQWFPSGRTEAQIAAQVQMKRTGGTWAAYKSDLKSGGYFEIRDGLWFATDAGIEYIGEDAPEVPSTTEEVVRLWGEKLRLGARNMLDVLIEHKGRNVTRDSLGKAIDMEPSGGTFAAYLSDLKQAGLILVDRDGVRANSETLLL